MEKSKEQIVWLIVFQSDGKFVRDVTKITSAENTSTSKTEEAEKCYCDSGCCAKKYAESYTTYCELLGIDDGATAVPYIDTGKEIIARHH